MEAYALVFGVAALVTFLTTPLVRRFVIKVGAIYRPNDRSVHKTPLPTMGGIAMYVGFVAALALSQFLPFFGPINRASSSSVATLIVCTLMLGLGVIDDTRGTTALSKLIAQIFIAGVLVLFGVQLSYLWFPWGVLALSGDLPVILTMAWAVAIPNAVNLVDGLDGLAAGMVAIASTAFFIFVVRSASGPFGDASQAALISAITCGICVGFLPWNFYPAKIFMGDAGSMLLGMLLAVATIEGVGNNLTAPSGGTMAAVVGAIAVPFLVLLIPLIDVVLAIMRRTWRGQGIGHADKEHLHHRLIDIGHGHREAVLLLYLWSALVSGAALAVGLIDGRFVAGLIIVGAGSLFLITALPRLAARRGNGNGAHVASRQVPADHDAPTGNAP